MEIAIKIVQLILSLSLLVFLHELGHYLTARMFGIRVEKFYIFMDMGGFSLFKFKIGETTFGLGWLPFGGYCKIAGMVDESMDTEALKQEPQPWEFRSKPAWQRLLVMIGGVVMNVIAACVIYIGMSWHWGERYIDNLDLKWGYAFNDLGHELGFEDGDKVVSFDGRRVEGSFTGVYSDMVIGGVNSVGVLRTVPTASIPEFLRIPANPSPDSLDTSEHLINITIPAAWTEKMLSSLDFMAPRMPFVALTGVGDIAAGDSLVAMNGVPMGFLDQIQPALAETAGSRVELTVVRDSLGVRVPRNIMADVSSEGKLGVGIKSLADFFPVRTTKYTLWQAIPAGFRRTGAEIEGYWQQLKMVVRPKTGAYKSVGSLISIGNIFPGQWEWYSFWRITAFLSIILAVMNILPIPALDGGHTLFLLWEVITRRRPSDKFLERAQMVGMVILLLIIVLSFGNDIYRFFIK